MSETLSLYEEGHSFLGIQFWKIQPQGITYFGFSQLLPFYEKISEEDDTLFSAISCRG